MKINFIETEDGYQKLEGGGGKMEKGKMLNKGHKISVILKILLHFMVTTGNNHALHKSKLLK